MIFVYLNGTRRGPFTEEQVRTFLHDGLLQSSDLASGSADGNLKPLDAFFAGLAAEAEPLAMKTEVPALQAAPVSLPIPSAAPQTPPASPGLPLHSLGPYARATLAPNETAYYKTSLHWIVFARFALMALLAFLFIAMPFAIAVQAITGSQIGWFALPLPAFMMIPPALAFVSSELVITDARVLIKSGIVRRQSLEMFIPKIESVAIDQGFIARLLDYGTVIIRGTGGFEEPFEAIARPIEFRNWVQRMQKTRSFSAQGILP